MNKETVGKLVFILTVVILALTGAIYGLQQIDVEALPAPLGRVVGIVVGFTSTGLVLFVVTFARSLGGYGVAYWTGDGSEAYDINKFYKTWTLYLTPIGTISTLAGEYIPSPWNTVITSIVALVVFVVDFTFHELRKLTGAE